MGEFAQSHGTTPSSVLAAVTTAYFTEICDAIATILPNWSGTGKKYAGSSGPLMNNNWHRGATIINYSYGVPGANLSL